MGAAPLARAGSASGVVGTSRLIGQASGAALVALCFSLSADKATHYALGMGSVFAAIASVASFSRLFVGDKERLKH